MVKEDFFHKTYDFAEGEDDIEPLIAFAKPLDAVDFAPAEQRVDLDGDEVEDQQAEVEHLPVGQLDFEPSVVAHDGGDDVRSRMHGGGCCLDEGYARALS